MLVTTGWTALVILLMLVSGAVGIYLLILLIAAEESAEPSEKLEPPTSAAEMEKKLDSYVSLLSAVPPLTPIPGWL